MLYAVEKEARGKPPAERVAMGQLKAKSVFDVQEAWLHAHLPKISGKPPLTQAIRYALVRMTKARPYLENGHLELDNNSAERAAVFQGFCTVICNRLCVGRANNQCTLLRHLTSPDKMTFCTAAYVGTVTRR